MRYSFCFSSLVFLVSKRAPLNQEGNQITIFKWQTTFIIVKRSTSHALNITYWNVLHAPESTPISQNQQVNRQGIIKTVKQNSYVNSQVEIWKFKILYWWKLTSQKLFLFCFVFYSNVELSFTDQHTLLYKRFRKLFAEQYSYSVDVHQDFSL